MHSHFTVILDACVLYPAMLRNVLLQLATTGLFRGRWSEQIHAEWLDSLLGKRPDLTRAQLEKTRAAMDRAVPDCLVTGYEPLIEGLSLPDAGDRHVLAAAIRCDADAIITVNLKHFPDEALEPYGVEAQHPDAFISHLLDLAPETTVEAVKAVRARLRRPPFTPKEMLLALRNLGLPITAERLGNDVREV